MDHMIILFLVFEETSILFSILAAPIYIPSNRVGGFTFLHTISSIYYLLTLCPSTPYLFLSFALK